MVRTPHTPSAPSGTTTTPPRDFRQEVTESIVKMLEDGVAPWQKPWEGQAYIPINHTTQKPYRGGNALYLMIVGMKRGYTDPRWMTYKQAADRGWQVRRGEKGAPVEFWDIKTGVKPGTATEGDDDEPNETGGPHAHARQILHRLYTVFNASQIDGVPPLATRPLNNFESVEAAENILAGSGANIAHDQVDRAYYSRHTDDIHLPRREAFKDAAGYYGTALHELAHWSGHPSRLNRPTLTDSYRFGDTTYAKEELRAELTSLFLAAERGIPHDTQSHAAYVGSWVKALKDDKNEIFRAASDASKATEYLLAFERTRSVDTNEQGDPATPGAETRTAGATRVQSAQPPRSR